MCLRRSLKDQAGCGRVRVEFSVWTYDAPLRRRNLSATVQHLSLGAYQRHSVRKAAHDIQFEFPRGVPPAAAASMHGATHCRIEERCEQPPWTVPSGL